jgi:RNA polymerase sigma-70 factor (ECF subfamily)
MTSVSAAFPASPAPAEVSDSDAIAEVVRGNREMFEVIVRRHNQRLYRVGMAYLRDHALVEDAMQNAYLKAYLHLRRFHGTAAFATWLTRIMINECLMLLRRHRRAPEQPLDREPDRDSESPAPGAAEQITLREMKHVLEQALQTLPRNYRAVYMLREVQQLSTAETAACLGQSPASVKVTLHRARERLKSVLLATAAGAELFAYPAIFCDPLTARVMHAILAIN